MKKSSHNHRILVDLIRQKKGYYIGSVVAVAFASFFMYLVPTIGKIVIDRVISEPRLDDAGFVKNIILSIGGSDVLASELWIAGGAIVLVTVLSGLFMYLKDYLAATACEGTMRSLRNDLFAHLHRISEKYLSKAESGDIVQRCTSDIDTLREFLTTQVMNIGRTVVLIIILVPLMIFESPIMSLFSLIMLPIVFFFAWRFFAKIKKLFLAVDEAEGELTTIVQENLTGIRVVRAFARQSYECNKFDEKNRQYQKAEFKLICGLADYWSLSDLLCIGQSGIVLIGGGWLAANGVISVGTYFAFIGYTTLLIWPIRQLGQELSEAGKATVAIGRIQEILAAPEEVESAEAPLKEVKLKGQLSFNDISFGFEKNREVLHNVSFDVSAGETIAIVGPTGAGKSTLIQLLMRMYDYEQGSIKLDDVELNNIDRKTVRKQIGSLLQEPFLFSRSLRDNIKFGRLNASDRQMIRSTNDASVHHTIENFKSGYETVIGEKGVSLSGGQKQRVTLSRTLLKETPILVLDDTLSAVDSATEQNILSALGKKRGKQTVLIITHRISVCQQADRIFVMQEGRITEQDSHRVLKDKSGFYQDLWQIQSGQHDEFENDLVVTV